MHQNSNSENCHQTLTKKKKEGIKLIIQQLEKEAQMN